MNKIELAHNLYLIDRRDNYLYKTTGAVANRNLQIQVGLFNLLRYRRQCKFASLTSLRSLMADRPEHSFAVSYFLSHQIPYATPKRIREGHKKMGTKTTKLKREQTHVTYNQDVIIDVIHPEFDRVIQDVTKLCNKLKEFNRELHTAYNAPYPQEQTHIYLMKNYANGLHKIGKSKDPKYRERTLQSQEPDIQIVFISPLTIAKHERILHKVFENKRVRGEWFDLTEEDIDYIFNYNYGGNNVQN